MDLDEINETLKAAQDYLSNLKQLQNEIENAEQQITKTSHETKNAINETYNNFIALLTQKLKNRQEELLQKTEKIETDSLKPIKDCKVVILDKIDSTLTLVSEGKKILSNKKENINNFCKNSSLLGSLPEVPELKEVSQISFYCDTNAESDILELCSRFGNVVEIAPVQICELIPKPGGILVEWEYNENEEKSVDIQEFLLERAFGNVVQDTHLLANFHECYKGPNTQYLCNDLCLKQEYSFRVCCKFEGNTDWSPWSLPQVSKSEIPAFCWAENKDFILSNENKIAKTITENPTILLSNGPQFAVGYSIEFTILELDKAEAIIGIIPSNNKIHTEDATTDLKNFKGHGFLVNNLGEITLDGVQKSTQLPKFVVGLKIAFTCELVNGSKVMAHIDSNERRVTYEWSIPKDCKMNFLAKFASSGWKIFVE